MGKAVMSWTGGKDSALALYRAVQQGYVIDSLITFGPRNPHFLAHPIPMIKAQAQALGLSHTMIMIEEPFRESYIRQLKILKKKGVSTVITGDIDLVEGLPNVMRQCCDEAGLNCHLPLWQENRSVLMKEILDTGFDITVTRVAHPSMDQSWCGRTLTRETIEELGYLPIDLCGENGEYHTMTLNMPLFKNRIEMIW